MFCIELHACDNFLELQLRQGSTTMDISKLMAPPTVFPSAIAHAFEMLMLQRQMLGEENDCIFARNLVNDLIEIWNANIKTLKTEFSKNVIGVALNELENNPESRSESIQRAMSERTHAVLKEMMEDMNTIVISKTPAALKMLG